MSPEQKRKFNTTFGTAFLVAGVVGFALTVYFAVTPAPPKPAPTYAGTTVNLESCSHALKSLGYPDVKVEKDDVIAHEPLGDDPRVQLDRASVAATMCKLELKSFCMGESCAQPGVTVVTTKPVNTRTTAGTAPDSSGLAPASGVRPASSPFGKAASAPHAASAAH